MKNKISNGVKPIKFSIIFLILFIFLQMFSISVVSALDVTPLELPNPLSSTTFVELLTKIADFLLTLAMTFAFIMIIWSGFKFVTSGGNEEKITSAKKNFTWTVIGIAIILVCKMLVTYIQEALGVNEVTTTTLQTFINKVGGTINSIIVLLFSLATAYFLWGVIQYVVGARGEDEKMEQGKRHMVWGIIGMAIMASAWGIVEIIKNYVT